MKWKIPHHLRRYRLGAGFTQEEMAHLLGSETAGAVSHYEGFSREPDLRVALAYEVVFGVPARELFPGIYKEVEKQVTKRARRLEERVARQGPKKAAWHKMRVLRAIGTRKPGESRADV